MLHRQTIHISFVLDEYELDQLLLIHLFLTIFFLKLHLRLINPKSKSVETFSLSNKPKF